MTVTLVETPAPIVTERIVRMALEEDIARGDLTSESCVPPDAMAVTEVRAREPLTLAGNFVAVEVFRQVDPRVLVKAVAVDGSTLGPGDVACRIEGPARSVLTGERVALNFMQRMSGVATLAARFVAAIPEGSHTRIVDTRKTTPGLRPFERYAVRCGGAHNHREDLSSAVLIKDNHIAAAGGVSAAIEAARARAPHTSRIECEVDTFEQLGEALEAGADIIMLDNFDDDQVRRAIQLVDGRALLEASGGVTLARIPSLAATGIDVISSGALTHSAPAVDLGLDWVG